MQAAFIVSDRTGKPYAVIGLMQGGTEFYPMSESAKNWAGWMKDEFSGKKISKDELVATLDNSMTIEGPVANVRANKARLEELIKKAKKPTDVSPIEAEKQTEEKSLQYSTELVEVLSLMDAHIGDIDNHDYRNVINFKAASFIADANRHTFAYEVKRTRAVWDPSLRIPGTERSGGWRCPTGTRYGGQITDRFGRNCGWGVARRLANEIADLGERAEEGLDKRRERRVNRRNERMMRRLQGGQGAVERAAGRVAQVLEGGRGDSQVVQRPQRERRGRRVVERAARRIAEALETDNNQRDNRQPALPQGRVYPGEFDPRAPRRPRAPQAQPRPREEPRVPRRPRAPQAQPLPGEEPRAPRAPRLPGDNDVVANRRRYLAEQKRRYNERKAELRRNRPDNISDTEWGEYQQFLDSHEPIIGFGGADNFDVPSFDEWKRGRTTPQMARPAGGRQPRPNAEQAPSMRNTAPPAGAPRAGETLDAYKRRKYNEHQQNVRQIREGGGNAGFLRYDEWERFHGPVVEENWRRAQPNGGRSARNTASEARVRPSATRRPTAEDIPEPQQPPRRQRRPFNAPNQRGFANEAAARRRRSEMERNNPDKDYKLVKYNDRFYVVDNDEVNRANGRGANLEVVAEAPRPARRPNAPAPAAPTPPSPAAGAPPAPSAPSNIPPAEPLNRLRNRHEGKALPRLANTDGTVRKVAVGNKGINNLAEAKAFTGSINDIPDEFLPQVMAHRSRKLSDLNGQITVRIKQARLDGGASLSAADKAELRQLKESGVDYITFKAGTGGANPSFYLHIADDGTIDGRGYLLKPPDGALGRPSNHAELVGAELARRIGFAHSMARVGDGGTYIMMELGPNLADGHVKDVRGGADSIRDRQSRFGMAVVNGIMGAGDRHGGNGMIFEGNGALPIDFGRSFINNINSPASFVRYMTAGDYRGLDSDPLAGYKARVAELVQGGQTREAARQAVRDEVRELTRNWAANMRRTFDDGVYDSIANQFQARDAGMRVFGIDIPSINARKDLIRQRIDFLDSDAFADAIAGKL